MTDTDREASPAAPPGRERQRAIAPQLLKIGALLLLFGQSSRSQGAADPATVGQWSAIQSWPIVAVHAQFLPTGKVMFYSYTDGAFLWDPSSTAVAAMAPAGFNIFCTGHSFLPDGRLLLTGGHIANNVGLPDASLYNAFTDSWQPQPLMNAGRWYPTNTTLPNGDVLVVAGDIDREVWGNPLPQVWQLASGTWRDLTSAQLALPLYPMMFLAPNGKVFNAGPEQTSRYLDTSGTGAWSFVANSNFGLREQGPAVMYDRGKVALFGGSDPPTATVETIDLQAATPTWRYVSPMSTPRRQHNATLLPDGTVLVTGGSSGAGFDNADAPVFETEVWDPARDAWTTLAPEAEYRGYHSTALLLPDGRVLSAGGDNHPTAQVFSPPYLFRGARPSITSAPGSWSYGQQIDIQTPDASSITAVNMIRLSAVTHTFNQEQRILSLPFTAGGGVLHVTAPSNRNNAPPGPYMLFVLNGTGVPSVARMLTIADGTALAAPASVTATAASANLVNLTWIDRSIAEEGFRIERAPGTSTMFSVIATVGQNASSYGDSSVAPSTTYSYRVASYNSSSTMRSATVTVTTPAAPTLGGPTGVRRFNGTTDYIDFPSAPQVSTVSVSLFFTPRSLPAAGERDVLLAYGEQGSTEPFTTHDKDLYLSPDGTLSVRVYAGALATARSSTKLQVGQRYHIGFTNSGTVVTLYVNGVVESALASPGSFAGYTDPMLRLAPLTDTLDPGTVSMRANGDVTQLGEWRVALSAAQMASLAAGASASSIQGDALVIDAPLTTDPPVASVGGPMVLNGTTFVPNTPPPAAPTALTATAVSANRVDLHWTDQSSNESGFRVRRATGSLALTTIATLAAGATSYSDLTVAGSTSYTYVVEAFNSSGAAASMPASVTTPAGGTSNGARRLNGTTDYIDFPSAPQVSEATIGFFFTPLSLPAAGERDVLVTYGEESETEPFTTHDKQLYLAPDGTLEARVWAGASIEVASTTKLQVGQRYYVGFTVSSSTLTLYVNGNAEAAVAAAGSFNGYANPTLRLAGLPDAVESGTVARRANGDVKGLGEWRIALSAANMASLAAGTAATSVQASSLVVAATFATDPPVADVGGPIVLNGSTFVMATAAPLPSRGELLAMRRP